LVFESQLKTGAEAGAYKESTVFLEKGSSAVVYLCQNHTIFIFESDFMSSACGCFLFARKRIS